MQMQMGACKLNECDFLETKFDAYESREDFYKDGCFNESEDGKMKGIFMHFIKDGKPHYEYPEVGLSEEEFTKAKVKVEFASSSLAARVATVVWFSSISAIVSVVIFLSLIYKLNSGKWHAKRI